MLELKVLQGKTPKDMWNEDLDAFMTELDVSCHLHASLHSVYMSILLLQYVYTVQYIV